MRNLIKLSAAISLLITTQFALGQQKAQSSTMPQTSSRDFCFNIVKPGHSGCPVGEDIPYETPLLEAVRRRDLELVKRLIAEGADVNHFDSRGISPLLLVAGGDFELIDILLNAGADVNAESKYGTTPLISSTMCSRAVKKFLQAGADVNKSNINKHTALMSAVKNGNIQSVRLLLDAKANVTAKDAEQMTALLYAIQNANMEAVGLLTTRFEDKVLFDEELLAKGLSLATINAQTEMVRFLLDKGADPIGKGKYRGAPLGYAVQKDNTEIVKLLLSAGAEVNLKNGYSPIYWASLLGRTENVKLLIDADADVDEPRFSNYWTPLVEAARNNHVEVMKLLKDAGADLNRRAYDGKTPLMYAAGAGKYEALKFLIENGADVNIRDEDDDETALKIARANNRSDIIKLLEKHGAIE